MTGFGGGKWFPDLHCWQRQCKCHMHTLHNVSQSYHTTSQIPNLSIHIPTKSKWCAFEHRTVLTAVPSSHLTYIPTFSANHWRAFLSAAIRSYYISVGVVYSMQRFLTGRLLFLKEGRGISCRWKRTDLCTMYKPTEILVIVIYREWPNACSHSKNENYSQITSWNCILWHGNAMEASHLRLLSSNYNFMIFNHLPKCHMHRTRKEYVKLMVLHGIH